MADQTPAVADLSGTELARELARAKATFTVHSQCSPTRRRAPKAADPRRDHLIDCERETASRRDREAAQAMHRTADAPAPVLVLVRHDQTAPGSTGAARIAGYRATPQTGHPPIPAGALWDLETELGYPADDPEGPTWLAHDQAPWAVVTTLMRRGSYTEGQALAEVLRWCARQTTPFDDVLWEVRRG